jgi:hypothetical protein
MEREWTLAGTVLISSLSAAIDVWITPEYQPIFRSVFNLAVPIRRFGIPGSASRSDGRSDRQ